MTDFSHVPTGALTLLEALERVGFSAYLVGGCVRDTLLCRVPNDYDITTAATPEEMGQALRGFRLIDTGLRHGTRTAVLADGVYEITAFRTEGAYSDSRRPDSVTFVRRVEEDLKRRDFTVNAMAWSPKRGLVDLFGGQEDLKNRVIRCVGNPEARFTEDALRILRALRFAAKLAFSIDADTAAAMERLAPRLSAVSAERRLSELTELFSHPVSASLLKSHPAVLCAAVPGLPEACVMASAERIEALPPMPEVRFAALLMEAGEGRGALFQSLRCSTAMYRTVCALMEAFPAGPPETEAAARHLLARQGREVPYLLCHLWEAAAPGAGERCRTLLDSQKDACTDIAHLALSGADLMALGVPAGKALGRALQTLLIAVLDGRVENTRETLTAYLKKEQV